MLSKYHAIRVTASCDLFSRAFHEFTIYRRRVPIYSRAFFARVISCDGMAATLDGRKKDFALFSNADFRWSHRRMPH